MKSVEGVELVSLDEVLNRVKRGAINLDPDLQRGLVWSAADKRELVKDVIRDGVIPQVVELRLISKKKSEVHDGKQRLTTLRDFRDGLFPVSDEEMGLFKTSFGDLSDELKETFLSAQVPIKRVKFDTDEEVLSDFIRINTKGRHARPFDVWFAHRGQSEFVSAIIKMSAKYKWMESWGMLANTEALLHLICYHKNLATDPTSLYGEAVSWPMSSKDIIYRVFRLREALALDETFSKFMKTAAAKQALVYVAAKRPEDDKIPALRKGFERLVAELARPEQKALTRRKHATASLIESLFRDKLKLV